MLIPAIYGSPVRSAPVLEAAVDQPAVTLWFMSRYCFSIIRMKGKPYGSPSRSYFALQINFRPYQNGKFLSCKRFIFLIDSVTINSTFRHLQCLCVSHIVGRVSKVWKWDFKLNAHVIITIILLDHSVELLRNWRYIMTCVCHIFCCILWKTPMGQIAALFSCRYK